MTTTSAPTVNYYEILSLPTNASADQIEHKIKEEQRTWRKRVGSADLGKRQEAETRMQRLAEAKATLLDKGRRAAYDRALPMMRTPDVPAPRTDGEADWVNLAKEYLAANDYHSAAYAAREATHTLGNSAEAWNLRSRANGGLGRFEDALYEARQAVVLEDRNAQYHFDLGMVQESMTRWSDALASYQSAASLDPSNFVFPLSIAGVWLQNNRPADALPILERVYEKHAGVEMVDFYLASCLHDLAEATPRVRNGNSYFVTSAEEIARMESLVDRAKRLHHGDRELAAGLRSIEDYLDKCRKSKFVMPKVLGEFADVGIGMLLFGFALVFLTPLFLVMGAFSLFGSGQIGGGLLCFLIAGLWVFGLYKRCWIPVWKANARSHR